MKLIVALFAVILLLAGCSTTRQALSQNTDTKDSVRVEHREKVIFVPDTVYVEIPAQTAERTTQDSTSHLENDFAESDARINADGSLYHDLKTKPQKKPVPTQKEIVERDSTIYESHAKAETEQVIKEVEIEKPLSWFQKSQIIGFWIVFVYLLIKNRRKLLAKLIRDI